MSAYFIISCVVLGVNLQPCPFVNVRVHTLQTLLRNLINGLLEHLDVSEVILTFA